MDQTVSKLPAGKTTRGDNGIAPKAVEWRPFESLRREMDRLFDDFNKGMGRFPFNRSVFDLEPFWHHETVWSAMPAVDIVEHEKDYQVMAELPGMDEKNIEVRLSNGLLTIRGEKKEDKEQKKQSAYLSERHFGSFERTFRIPDGVDADRINASFRKGVLTVLLPKTPAAQTKSKTISIKAS